VSRKRWERNG